MAAYYIFQIEVTDPERYKDYVAVAPATIANHGGEYLVRGGDYEVVEGEWPARRMVVLRFPSMEQARAWYDSAEYAQPKSMRHGAAKANAILVEGV